MPFAPTSEGPIPDEEVHPPCFRRQAGRAPCVVSNKIVGESRLADPIRPCDREGHLLGRMDPALRERTELVDLLGRPEPQLEPRRPQSHVEEGCEIDHSSSPSGWLKLERSDVAREAQRRRPVSDDAKLPAQEGQGVQVVAPGDEPTGKSRQVDPEDVRDPLEAAERRHLAEHAIAVGLGDAGEVSRQAACLSQGVLASRWIGAARRLCVRDGSAVPECPDVVAALDAQGRVDPHAAASSRGSPNEPSSGEP